MDDRATMWGGPHDGDQCDVELGVSKILCPRMGDGGLVYDVYMLNPANGRYEHDDLRLAAAREDGGYGR